PLEVALERRGRHDIRDERLELRNVEPALQPLFADVYEERLELRRPGFEAEQAPVAREVPAVGDELVELPHVPVSVRGGVEQPAGNEYAPDLGERSRPVRDVVEHVAREHDVERLAR